MEKDTYKTLVRPSEEVLLKEKNSKFFARAFPVTSQDEVKEILEEIQKMHHKAGHHCYAWQLGKEEEEFHYRANDDGEPANSAGMPIYGQIQSFGLTEILIVVTRYFGGVKLGVGGLIQAYKNAAKMALEQSEVKSRTINIMYAIRFDYPQMNSVMRLIRENNVEIINQELNLDCSVIISVRKKFSKKIFGKFNVLHKVTIVEIRS